MKYLNTNEMMALEKHAFENYPITLEQMMQNAGQAVFEVVMEQIPDQAGNDKKQVLVVAGKGNNGGDALVAARLLREKGIEVTILSEFTEGGFQWDGYSLIIDAIFGFSLKGNPRQPEAKIIEQINCSQTPVLSVDVPSGLDVHDGSIGKPTVKANYTVALGMLKKGFEEHPDLIGKVYLGDLGIPEAAYRDMGYEPPLFRGNSTLSVN
ncbi:NAD(P)H-hydrate epimerase [Candidatus Pacearchaeota archaeon]|nr:NAD(P)H-hydrate epimerase [Candidatus Pacearchaeota archaeon]